MAVFVYLFGCIGVSWAVAVAACGVRRRRLAWLGRAERLPQGQGAAPRGPRGRISIPTNHIYVTDDL